MVARQFEDLTIWQRARALNRAVHDATRTGTVARDRSFVDQMRRAALSVMNNIAEGFERYRRNEFMNYLGHAKGSAGEVRSMCYSGVDVGYFTDATFQRLLDQAAGLGRQIGAFRSRLEASPVKLAPARSTRTNRSPRE